MHAIGVDIGGTKIAVGVVDQQGVQPVMIDHEQQVQAAAASVRAARQAIHTATQRRAAAVAAAQDLADAAYAAERAEQDAARAAAAAGLHRLKAQHLTPPQIVALCGLPPVDV
jgi:molecular chaperone DnaK (HSP70)